MEKLVQHENNSKVCLVCGDAVFQHRKINKQWQVNPLDNKKKTKPQEWGRGLRYILNFVGYIKPCGSSTNQFNRLEYSGGMYTSENDGGNEPGESLWSFPVDVETKVCGWYKMYRDCRRRHYASLRTDLLPMRHSETSRKKKGTWQTHVHVHSRIPGEGRGLWMTGGHCYIMTTIEIAVRGFPNNQLSKRDRAYAHMRAAGALKTHGRVEILSYVRFCLHLAQYL